MILCAVMRMLNGIANPVTLNTVANVTLLQHTKLKLLANCVLKFFIINVLESKTQMTIGHVETATHQSFPFLTLITKH